MISFIWAQTKDGIIGKDGKLPWSIPAEMKHFTDTTLNHSIVMGRKTFASMNYKPLANRMNYVLSKDTTVYKGLYAMRDLIFIDNIDSLLKRFKDTDDELFVIGGDSVFSLFLPYADKLIRTTIKKDYTGDVSMIKINYNEYSKYKEIDSNDFIIEYFMKKGITNNGNNKENN